MAGSGLKCSVGKITCFESFQVLCVSATLQVNCSVNSGTRFVSSKTDGRFNLHRLSFTFLGKLG